MQNYNKKDMPPIIGVVPDYSYTNEQSQRHYTLRENYITRIHENGGKAFIIPYCLDSIDFYIKMCDGIMFTGGGYTIDPSIFNQERITSLPINHRRTEFEMALFRKALCADSSYSRSAENTNTNQIDNSKKKLFESKMIPILGICAGAQLINVALGGDLIQVVQGHAYSNAKECSHEIFVSGGKILPSIACSKKISVNSSHSQAIGRIGDDIVASAVCDDGIIECIEKVGHDFCLGVQWHPEYYANEALDSAIFRAFIEASARYKANSSIREVA
ncbi:gamma-glutamyl-gamma-aminobutyrate hydrolase family protein [Candidatus Hydrogenosomobacter endosymbioticus]|uniref:Gamma-glutamyl-gamma-aminobutyrate hydrolase n=1 Tax=Candidatus Hydrogenosomobacter endosymbioticus TaxID=2558174 RepID=A0ABN6L3G7_9PROT|nr:type 1 glutamine amidotransferase [Candidatus Hydrogenosomobacter endosymbioticus]BDB96264.1 gamma-glutamyl-gamma-aminobutyrate hydrolase [Candidatus Hydrogenosomobacter endosymbioticus]